MKNKAIFWDRDGIFNHLVPWGGGLCAPRSWPEVTFYEGWDEIPQLKKKGYLLILVTNQPDIERNIIERRFVDDLNSIYKRRYDLDGIYMCPFSSDAHPMKKPNPGMLLKASEDFEIDLSKSFFVGDTDKDVQAAEKAGVTSILCDRDYNRNVKSDYRIRNFKEIDTIV